MDNFDDKPLSQQPQAQPQNPASASFCATPANHEVDPLKQVESVRQLAISTLMLVLILSGVMNIYFWRLYRDVKRELAPLKPKAAQMLAECNAINQKVNDVARRLAEFGRTHADFQPILARYGIDPNTLPAAVPPSASSTSLTPPPAKGPAPVAAPGKAPTATPTKK